MSFTLDKGYWFVYLYAFISLKYLLLQLRNKNKQTNIQFKAYLDPLKTLG